MSILVRADASERIGIGHIMRCLALTDGLEDVTFISREHPGNINEFIHRPLLNLPSGDGKAHDELRHSDWLGVSWKEDADACKQLLGERRFTHLVVDHYALDSRWEQELSPFVDKILVLDDLADRRHNCDFLLDQNLTQRENRYEGLLNDDCQALLGLEYALLRPEFSAVSPRERSGKIERILVFLGGSDPTCETEKALQALKQLSRPEIAVDLVIGQSNSSKVAIEDLAQELPNVQCHYKVPTMSELINAADLAIGAAGTSTWERCCLGLPQIVIVISENQEIIAQAVEDFGLGFNLGFNPHVESICQAIDALDTELLLQIGERAKGVVDGKGVRRVRERVFGK